LFILVIMKPLVYGECRRLSLINDSHPPSKLQPSIFRAASYRSAVRPQGSIAGGKQSPQPPGQGHYNSAFRLSLGFVVYSAVNVDKIRECHRYIIWYNGSYKIAHAQKPGLRSATFNMLPRSMARSELGNKIRVSTSLLPYNSFLPYRV